MSFEVPYLESQSQSKPKTMEEDLAESGLSTADIRARIAGPSEKQATNTPVGVDGYVIPYFNMWGHSIPFYRVKLLNSPDPKVKYKQLATAENHVYFPLGLKDLLPKAKYIMITEGEKKAACAVKHGFPCVALGGVESWRNRTLVLAKDTKMGTNSNGQVVAKIPAGSEGTEKIGPFATGLKELIDYIRNKDIPVIICFDSDYTGDPATPIRFEVQRAAATLGFELRFQGIRFCNIKQLVLDPEGDTIPKLGIDDFLMHPNLGVESLKSQLKDTLDDGKAFPRHPNIRSFVNKRLKHTQLSRHDLQALGIAIISDLDIRGSRLRCPNDDRMYYFDDKDCSLTPVVPDMDLSAVQHPFIRKMYRDYGLTINDSKIMGTIFSQFCAEETVHEVYPEKVHCWRDDTFYYQITDGLMVKVDAKGIALLPNGRNNVLFEGGHVAPIDRDELVKCVRKWKGVAQLPNIWYPIIKDTRIIVDDPKYDYGRKLLSVLYAISPWFYQWRKTQLPIEQIIGESGSGKTTLCDLRQQLILGNTILRNAPRDIKDWGASVASSGAIHVTDNVHMVDRKLKQQLSDEICRVITASNPLIESRKLFTDNSLALIPVKCVFAVTAIRQPFTNTDIIQRSIITRLDEGNSEISYYGNWVDDHLKKIGGRVNWIAHQLVFIHRLILLINEKWDPKYSAKFRLINLEQLMMLAAEVLGLDSKWIPRQLEEARDLRTVETDPVLSGLQIWADTMRGHHNAKSLAAARFTAADISEFFMAHDEFSDNQILISARKLGHYFEDRRNLIAKMTGIIRTDGKINNRWAYSIRPPKVYEKVEKGEH